MMGICKNCRFYELTDSESGICGNPASLLHGKLTDVSCKCERFSEIPKDPNACDFCDGKRIAQEGCGEGFGTVLDNANELFSGVFGVRHETHSGIALLREKKRAFLTYDNSAGEYADGMIKIKYCPICGKKL